MLYSSYNQSQPNHFVGTVAINGVTLVELWLKNNQPIFAVNTMVLITFRLSKRVNDSQMLAA